MTEILVHMVNNHSFTISDEALAYAHDEFIKKYDSRTESFANAREVRNFFESGVVSQADRLFGKENLTDEDLWRLEMEDFLHNEIMIE